MRAVVLGLVAVLLFPMGAAGARPPVALSYEDPDDTGGPLDVLRVTRTDVSHYGGLHYQHRIDFQQRWEDDTVAIELYLHERDFRRSPLCEADTCTGTWVGEVYEDERGNLQAYMAEVSNCDACSVDFEIPVREEDGSILVLVPRALLYAGRHWYTLQFRTQFSNLLGANASVECRLELCEDYAADDETTMRFPVGR